MFSLLSRLRCIQHWRVGIWPKHFFILCYYSTSDDFILQVNIELILLVDHRLEELANVIGVQRWWLARHSWWEVSITDDANSIVGDDFVLFSEFAISTIFSCHVYNDTARLHRLHHLSSDKFRCWFSRNQRRSDHNVYLLTLLPE